MAGQLFDSNHFSNDDATTPYYDDFTFLDDIVNLDDLAAENQDDSAFGATIISQPLSPSSISDNQERVLSILMVVSAALSMLGSASIIYKILRDRQFSKPYHRTLIALSTSDVIASLTFAMYPFLMPKGVRVWSVGNQSTCTALGFFTQLSFAAVGYNCILSFYYFLAIRYNMDGKTFSRKYERPMHLINLLFFLATASAGAAMQFYSAIGTSFRSLFAHLQGMEFGQKELLLTLLLLVRTLSSDAMQPFCLPVLALQYCRTRCWIWLLGQ